MAFATKTSPPYMHINRQLNRGLPTWPVSGHW